jgi:hypothetical protein
MELGYRSAGSGLVCSAARSSSDCFSHRRPFRRRSRPRGFYTDKECWDSLFYEAPGLHLNTVQVWDAVKEARKRIGTRDDVDVGQNVVTEIRDYRPVQFEKGVPRQRLATGEFRLSQLCPSRLKGGIAEKA